MQLHGSCIKANFHSLNERASAYSDRQSLISIVKRLRESETTAEHKFKF